MTSIIRLYKNIISRFPYVREMKSRLDELHASLAFPPGHYYSPIFDGKLENHVNDEQNFLGIELNSAYQKHLMHDLEKFVSEFDFPKKHEAGHRYYTENDFYTGYDATTLFCLMRNFKPSRIIEIGSGYSSALMLDTNERWGINIDFTFIEPFPDRLLGLLKEEEKGLLVKDKIQNVDLGIFDQLKENDFLIIDTSHVSKTDSDVNHILFKILPRLNKGVLIHFHDIFYPFEYPKKWIVEEKRSWNEIYVLRAFLMYNRVFDIIFFNDYLKQRSKNSSSPFFEKAVRSNATPMGSLWLQKTEN